MELQWYNGATYPQYSDLKDLFKPFVKGVKVGLGLGLFIVKIVKIHKL
jgi:C4-dicarboxylate-specific signal transduction histidine kinase